MDLSTVLPLLGLVLGGAGMWGFLTKRLETSAARDERQIKTLAEKVSDLERRESACQNELVGLKQRVNVLEGGRESMLPRWTKNIHRQITSFNDEFFMRYVALLPMPWRREDVYNKTFDELGFPHHVTAEIEALDMAALRQRGQEQSAIIPMLDADRPEVVVKVAGLGGGQEIRLEGLAHRSSFPHDMGSLLRRMEADAAGSHHEGAAQ
ncbi:MAG TPA: hypothetical protein VEZ41_01435 [Allosphingosinicella sp.]|nr:hypothetical protein [Allosphingosinicella sp.]